MNLLYNFHHLTHLSTNTSHKDSHVWRVWCKRSLFFFLNSVCRGRIKGASLPHPSLCNCCVCPEELQFSHRHSKVMIVMRFPVVSCIQSQWAKAHKRRQGWRQKRRENAELIICVLMFWVQRPVIDYKVTVTAENLTPWITVRLLCFKYDYSITRAQ